MHVTITLETPSHTIEARGWYIERNNSCDGNNWKEWERTDFDIIEVEDLDSNPIPSSDYPMFMSLHGNDIATLLDEAAQFVI
jgi:hypothetical protein